MPDDQKQNQLFESVSALTDNQASPLELQRILAMSEKSNGVRTRWHRYHLTRAIMRGESKGLMTGDISDKVRSAIADLEIDFGVANTGVTENKPTDSKHVAQSVAKGPITWFAPFGRAAIAASVALAVVLGAQQIPLQQNNTANEIANDVTPINSGYQVADFTNSANLNRLTVQNVSRASFSKPEVNSSSQVQLSYDNEARRRQQGEEEQVRQAINSLMLEHAQQASLDQSVGLVPFIRVSDSALQSKAAQ